MPRGSLSVYFPEFLEEALLKEAEERNRKLEEKGMHEEANWTPARVASDIVKQWYYAKKK